MAGEPTAKAVEVNLVDRLYIKMALINQKRALERSRAKEVPGGDVWSLRGKEIEGLDKLIARFS